MAKREEGSQAIVHLINIKLSILLLALLIERIAQPAPPPLQGALIFPQEYSAKFRAAYQGQRGVRLSTNGMMLTTLSKIPGGKTKSTLKEALRRETGLFVDPCRPF